MPMPMRKEAHFGRVMNCYADRPRHVGELLAQSFARAGEALAVVDGRTRLGYPQLDAAARALAAHLRARGLRQGDRVAVMLTNQAEAVISVVALARLGAILVPLGTRLRCPEIGYIFEDAQPVALIHGSAFAAELPDTGPAGGMRFDCDSAAWAAMLQPVAGTDVEAGVEPIVEAVLEISEEDIFGILYTSGTTGKPKGALLTHLNVVHSCLHWQDAHSLGRDDRTLLAIPCVPAKGLRLQGQATKPKMLQCKRTVNARG